MDQKKLSGFKAWLHEEELSENTVSSYLTAIKQFYDTFDAIDRDSLLAWKAEMIENYNPKTVNLRLSAMDRFIDYMGLDEKLKLKKIKIMKRTSLESNMTIESYQRLIDGLKKDAEARWIANYEVLAKTGARISEGLAMTKADLDRGSMQLYTKNKVRTVFVPDSLREELKEYCKDMRPEDKLIRNRHGGPLTSRGYAVMMRKHAEKYGIPQEAAHPHALRHMFAVEFLKRNNDISLLADLLGHSNVNTTMIYTRRTAEEQKAMLNEAINW